ncbi:nitroreductase family protein [Bacteroides helcogenes]|uniref:Nitroreductase n=1 Tax=Bacteroides helcogenes (strain ATCC 35417 / DSM 20613 / JCM 6297 / CCUG 15421 / P 36-108) TaxID=693979 RepID=E6SNC4_BACT6|nr:nitroreductase family protein [Bacteroides helcogenes]ADV42717.1 nitroreductase [Bacteroides helcogenes P 36-108]MDY5239548.1 nitroreductase family protein [Bacteroides helcogenes]
MNIETIRQRHSVRSYTDKPIDAQTKTALLEEIAACNKEGGLSIQLVTEEPQAFSCRLAKYGKFSGVRNYLLLIGGKHKDEACGYYGERIVLKAQTLGLNSCWVGLTYSKVKGTYSLQDGEKIYLAIALGYGSNQGIARKSKSVEAVSRCKGDMPEWFRKGVEAALMAPTAMNQQAFRLILEDSGKVHAKAGLAVMSKIDLGIVKCHFEIGSGRDSSVWK